MIEPLLVNQTRWSDLLKQLGVIKGLDHVELNAALVAALVLENDRPEHKYLSGEALAWGQYLLAAPGAGVTGYVGLRNPVGSGKLVVTEELRAIPGIYSQFLRVYIGLARAAANLTARSTEQPRDTRLQPTGAFGVGAPGIVGQIVSATSDTLTPTPFVVAELLSANSSVATQSAATPAIWRQPVILTPGDTVFLFPSDGVGGTQANANFQASFVWRERTLEPTET